MKIRAVKAASMTVPIPMRNHALSGRTTYTAYTAAAINVNLQIPQRSYGTG